MKNKKKNILGIALIASLLPIHAFAESVTIEVPESKNQTRTHVTTMPQNAYIQNIGVNTGNVSYTKTGDQLTLNLSNGAKSRSQYNSTKYSKYISTSRSSSTDSFPYSISYSDGEGYSGSYSKSGSSYVSNNGTYTPEDRRTESDYRETSPGGSSSSLPSSITYSSGGYSGTLSGGTASVVRGLPYDRKLESDTRVTSPGAGQNLPASLPYNSGGYVGTLNGGSYLLVSGTEGSDRKEKTGSVSRTYGCRNSYVYDEKAKRWTDGGTEGTEFIHSFLRYQDYYSDGYRGNLDGRVVTSPCGSIPPSGAGKDGERRYGSTSTTTLRFSGTVVKDAVPDTQVWRRNYSGWVERPSTEVYGRYYSGTVIRPASDTRIWTQHYDGTAYAGGYDDYYKYTVTVDYGTDTEKPDGIITANPTTWTNGNVTLTLSDIKDYGDAGINGVFLPNGTFVNGSSIPYNVSTNGTYSFIIEDKAGNRTTKSIDIGNIDKVSPTATLSQTPSSFTNQDVVLNLTNISDGGVSGLKEIVFPDGTIETSFENKSYTVTENGSYTFKIRDNAGNETVRTITVSNIDKTPPTASITQSPSAWTNGNVTLTLSNVQDAGVSGLKRITLPNGNTVSPSTSNYVVTENGTYNFIVEDNAGNQTVKTIEVKNIDKSLPTATISKSTNSFTNENVELYLKDIQDVGVSGLKSIKLPNGQLLTVFEDVSYPVTGNGTYRFEIHDNAGNITISEIEVSNIDKEKPTFTVDYSPKLLNKGPVTIFINNVFDNGVSGLKDFHSDISGSLPPNNNYQLSVYENGTYTFTVTDKAGNKEIKTLTISNIDNGLPSAKVDWKKDWTNESVIIELTDFRDEGTAGYKSTKLPNGLIVTGSTNYYTVQQNGVYRFELEDFVGNVRIVDVMIENIDKEKPMVEIQEKDKTNDNVKAIIKVRDVNLKK